MKYANLPEAVLNIELGEFYVEGDSRVYTVKDELNTIDEDLVDVQYELSPKDDKGARALKAFTAWTENYVLQLVDTIFNESAIIAIPRNPIK